VIPSSFQIDQGNTHMLPLPFVKTRASIVDHLIRPQCGSQSVTVILLKTFFFRNSGQYAIFLSLFFLVPKIGKNITVFSYFAYLFIERCTYFVLDILFDTWWRVELSGCTSSSTRKCFV
jgi:hypothetical protein